MNWKQGLFRVWLVLLPVPGVYYAYSAITGHSGHEGRVLHLLFGIRVPPLVSHVAMFAVPTLTIAIASATLYLIG